MRDLFQAAVDRCVNIMLGVILSGILYIQKYAYVCASMFESFQYINNYSNQHTSRRICNIAGVILYVIHKKMSLCESLKERRVVLKLILQAVT